MKHLKNYEEFTKMNENIITNKYHELVRGNEPKISQYMILADYFGINKKQPLKHIKDEVNSKLPSIMNYLEMKNFIKSLDYWNMSDIEIINGKTSFWKGYNLKAKSDMIIAKSNDSSVEDVIHFDEVMDEPILQLNNDPIKLHQFIMSFVGDVKTSI